jgi:hypothetical protein
VIRPSRAVSEKKEGKISNTWIEKTPTKNLEASSGQTKRKCIAAVLKICITAVLKSFHG